MQVQLGISPWKKFPEIRKFTRKLGIQGSPEFLPVVPTAPLVGKDLDIEPSLLLPELPEILAKCSAGEVLTGWRILHVPGVLLEAMPYSVWKSEDCGLIHPVWHPVESPFLWVRDEKALETHKAKGSQFDIYHDDKETRAVVRIWKNILRTIETKASQFEETADLTAVQDLALFFRTLVIRKFSECIPQSRDRCPCGSKSKFAKCCEEDFWDFYDQQFDVWQELYPDYGKLDPQYEWIESDFEDFTNPVEQANPTLVNQR